MDMRKLVGRNVKRIRQDRGLTQEELAERSGIQPAIHQRPRAGPAQPYDRQHLRAGNRPRCQPHGARAPNRGTV